MFSFKQRGFDAVSGGFEIASFLKCHSKDIGNNRVVLNNKNMHNETSKYKFWVQLILLLLAH
jgi:hypothetical protein